MPKRLNTVPLEKQGGSNSKFIKFQCEVARKSQCSTRKLEIRRQKAQQHDLPAGLGGQHEPLPLAALPAGAAGLGAQQPPPPGAAMPATDADDSSQLAAPPQVNWPWWTDRSPKMVKWGDSQESPSIDAVLPQTRSALPAGKTWSLSRVSVVGRVGFAVVGAAVGGESQVDGFRRAWVSLDKRRVLVVRRARQAQLKPPPARHGPDQRTTQPTHMRPPAPGWCRCSWPSARTPRSGPPGAPAA
jgi:hypothetical protein